MNKKVFIPLSVVLIYFVLILLFIYFFEKSQGCAYFSPCIRFCSADNYSDNNLLQNFKESKTGKNMIILNTNFKVFRGTPPCGEMTHISSGKDGDFSKMPYRFDYVSIS